MLDPLLGRSIDRYLLAGKLGEGGMGAVYLALQRPLDREVALKVISGLELTQATVARFEREARAIALLDHANIRKLYDYGIGEIEFRIPYMALEYVRHGRTLRHALDQVKQANEGLIPGDVILLIFRQVLNALGAAHEQGIVHRDMKPDNVMLAPEHGNPYMVKILDFGLAKVISDVSGFDGDVSRTGQFLGTPYYMAPEQAPNRGRGEADGRCDLYAVAVMLFEVFAGRRPFDGESALEIIGKKTDATFDPMRLPEALDLPRALRSFLTRSLAQEPRRRYQSASQMLEALERALSGHHATAVGMTLNEPSSSQERPATPSGPLVEADLNLSATRPVERKVPRTRVETIRKNYTLSDGSTPTWRDHLRRWWPWLAAPLVAFALVGGLFLAFVPERHGLRGGVPGEPPGGRDASTAEGIVVAVMHETPGDAAKLAAAGSDDAPSPPGLEPVPSQPSQTERGTNREPPPVAIQDHLRVRFESEPPGADVLVGGRFLGKTAFEIALEGEAGPREFLFRLEGYRVARVHVDVADGRVVQATLRRQAAPVGVPKSKPSPGPKRDDYPEL